MGFPTIGPNMARMAKNLVTQEELSSWVMLLLSA
jgi:hypothetical protein